MVFLNSFPLTGLCAGGKMEGEFEKPSPPQAMNTLHPSDHRPSTNSPVPRNPPTNSSADSRPQPSDRDDTGGQVGGYHGMRYGERETGREARAPHSGPDRPAEYAIYKPNQRGSGGVVRFELNPAKASVFVEAASQSGEKQFDWPRKITMKWGLPDLGSMLAVLRGRQTQAKLFHQSAKANSAFEFTLRDDPRRAPYFMSLSRQESADQSVRKVTIPLTHSEAAVLEVLLDAAVRRLQGW